MSAPALMLAWSSPATDRTAEFDTWYETVHIPEVRAILGTVGGATRYRLADPGKAPRYLAVYELTDPDIGAAAQALGAASAEGRMTMSDAMDLQTDPPVLEFYVANQA